nr:leucine rich repeat [Hymenolepis microstoma]
MIGHPLTETMILRRAQKECLEKVKRVNLWGLRICDASLLLRVPTLEVISLSSNNISNLKPFSACVKLKELYLRNNSIFDLNEVRHLSGLSLLHTLFLLGNPCCYPPDIEKVDVLEETAGHYRPTVIKYIPSLIRLDLKVITEAERLASRQLIPAPSFPVTVEHANATHEDATDKSQRQRENQSETAVEKDSEQAAAQQTTDQSMKGFAPKAMNEIDVFQTFDRIPCDAEPSNWTRESIRQTISNLSLVHKQTLTEILHLLPRLNDDALALLANEIANRRRRHNDLITPVSPKSTSPSP